MRWKASQTNCIEYQDLVTTLHSPTHRFIDLVEIGFWPIPSKGQILATRISHASVFLAKEIVSRCQQTFYRKKTLQNSRLGGAG